MNWAVICVFALIAYYSYYRTRIIIHPAVVVSVVWTILLFSYDIFDHGLYPLSDKFYLAIFLWVVPFCITSLSTYNSKYRLAEINYNLTCKKKIDILLDILIIVNAYYLYRLYSFSSVGYYQKFLMLSSAGKLPFFFTAMNYVNQVSLVLFAIICLINKCINRYKFYLFCLLLFACCLLMSIKTMLAQVIFIVIIIKYLKGKFDWKKAIIALAILFALMISVQVYRSYSSNNEFDLIQFISVYALSPLPAFDLALNGNVRLEEGGTYRFFLTFFNKVFGCDFNVYSGGDRWVEVPVLTNVYTVMSNPFADFGYVGIFVFAMVEGWFWSILYKKGVQQNKIRWKIIYAVFFYTLIFQFFSDYIFTFFSVLLQLFIVVHFFFYKKHIYEN